MDPLMAVSMECTSMAQEMSSFPLPPSPMRYNDTVFFSLSAELGTVSEDSYQDN